ncbi:MAG: hypothetical protein KC503_20505 [Myxococcales bacterium]|nr:hypothetical protein [Myxococcales bacterium]
MLAAHRLLHLTTALALLALVAGCDDSGDFYDARSSSGDAATRDGPGGRRDGGDLTQFTDGRALDGGGAGEGGAGDGGAGDGAARDAAADATPACDSSVDTAPARDSSVDTAAPGDSSVDSTRDSGSNPTGLTVPCKSGPGWTLFRFHYDSGSTSARIDVWDASCSYSFAPNSACNVREVYPGFGTVSRTSQGYPIFTTTQYLRVRFSAAGLSFSKAAVYIQARSYATSSSTYFRIWSPLYGAIKAGPVDNDFVYDWYGVDWTGLLYPSDQPSLTAIQVYADSGSGQLAVKAVELCVQ